MQVELRLVGNSKIGLACRNELGWVCRVGRRNNLNVQILVFEINLLLGKDDRTVIRVNESVKDEGHFIGSLNRRTGQ